VVVAGEDSVVAVPVTVPDVRAVTVSEVVRPGRAASVVVGALGLQGLALTMGTARAARTAAKTLVEGILKDGVLDYCNNDWNGNKVPGLKRVNVAGVSNV
jgi:hypothetical protein